MPVIAYTRLSLGFGALLLAAGVASGEALWGEFAGDTAGLRAAGRAVDRALPLLKPGYTLRLATLPEGEDPDTLVLRHGVQAMREVLEQARFRGRVLWVARDALERLRLDLEMARFDLDVTRRERENLRRLLEDH